MVGVNFKFKIIILILIKLFNRLSAISAIGVIDKWP